MTDIKGKLEFRTGTHNPHALYVVGETQFPPASLPGWMRQLDDGQSEWFIGSLPEAVASLAVEAMNGLACRACPWGCISCSLNRATCECYEHSEPGPEEPPIPPQHVMKSVECPVCLRTVPMGLNGLFVHVNLAEGAQCRGEGWIKK